MPSDGQERPGATRAGAAFGNKKTPESRIERAFLGVKGSREGRSASPQEVTAADQEDESFAAHAAIVADAAADCKRGKRANGALERASFGENGAFRRGSVGIRACAGRARRARRGGEPGQNRRRAM